MSKFGTFFKCMTQKTNDKGYVPWPKGKELAQMGSFLGGIYAGLTLVNNTCAAVGNAAFRLLEAPGKAINYLRKIQKDADDYLKHQRRLKDINAGNISSDDRDFLSTRIGTRNRAEQQVQANRAKLEHLKVDNDLSPINITINAIDNFKNDR